MSHNINNFGIVLENDFYLYKFIHCDDRTPGHWGFWQCQTVFPLSSGIFIRFLTKREQKLMQRRQHAEELLEWKRRLDAEEAEIRRMEKQALAAWDKERLKTKTAKKELGNQRAEPKGNTMDCSE